MSHTNTGSTRQITSNLAILKQTLHCGTDIPLLSLQTQKNGLKRPNDAAGEKYSQTVQVQKNRCGDLSPHTALSSCA